MKKVKRLDGNFKEVEGWRDVRYVIHENEDVELTWEKESEYTIITAEEIQKLAEILKEGK